MKRSILALTTTFALACSPTSPDDSSDEETSTTGNGDGDGDSGDGDGDTGDGDGDSGDGDGDSGDGDGDTGDGDGDTGDGDGDGGDGLEPICTQGCMHAFECAPMEVMTYYADVQECVDACHSLWGACVPEGSAYLYCALGLECPDVVTLLTDGPPATECGPAFDAAQAACMNG